MVSAARRITTLEMKELNERQRAEHAHRLYEHVRNSLTQVEERNAELEAKFAEVNAPRTTSSVFLLPLSGDAPLVCVKCLDRRFIKSANASDYTSANSFLRLSREVFICLELHFWQLTL